MSPYRCAVPILCHFLPLPPSCGPACQLQSRRVTGRSMNLGYGWGVYDPASAPRPCQVNPWRRSGPKDCRDRLGLSAAACTGHTSRRDIVTNSADTASRYSRPSAITGPFFHQRGGIKNWPWSASLAFITDSHQNLEHRKPPRSD